MKGRIKKRRKTGQRDIISRMEDHVLDEKIQQSDNRRKFIEKLDKKTGEFARREFAKLGLF